MDLHGGKFISRQNKSLKPQAVDVADGAEFRSFRVISAWKRRNFCFFFPRQPSLLSHSLIKRQNFGMKNHSRLSRAS